MNPGLASALSVTPESPARWIVVGQMLDAKNRRILKNVHLIYDRNRILHAGTEAPQAALLNGRQAPDLTLPEHTVMPGLIEGHAHLFLEGAELDIERRTAYLKQDAEALYQKAESRLRAVSRMGVVAIRDGGDKDHVGLRLSKLTATNDCPSSMAKVFSPGAATYRQGRYGAFFGQPLEEFPDIEGCVQARVSEGADHIKIVPTGIISFAQAAVTGTPQFSIEEIQRFKRAAHAHQRHLMAHASGEIGVGHAIDGGVNTVEHGFFIADDQLAMMRDRGIAWLPTLTPVQKQVDHAARMGWEGNTLDNLRQILENHARSIQIALAMGVNVLVGSDAGSYGVPHGTGMFYEMELLEAAGMPAMDILCQVTYGNNRALTNNQPLGSLEKNFGARFIVTKNNPLETVKNLALERLVLFDKVAASSSPASLDHL